MNLSSIDALVYDAVFAQDTTTQENARENIKKIASEKGIFAASIKPFYDAIGRNEVSGFTVPALNIRSLTYDMARIVFQLAFEKEIGPFIFEIARSEMEYTNQSPEEYAIVIFAAAIKEGYNGPIFLQGDHFQINKTKFIENKDQELTRIQNLITKAISANFYNIDIDASTIVDLKEESLDKQQEKNYQTTAELTNFIRQHQPYNITISIGGEIGHIGGKNSTVSDFEAFMQGYLNLINEVGLSKISVQTGTSHGGIPDALGKIKNVNVDFSVLEQIGKIAREKYGMAGAVQHGASTLSLDMFDKFPSIGTAEIHLATGWQNIIFDNLPEKLKLEMYQWIKENHNDEWNPEWNENQFIYKLRKKALGPFKKKLWELTDVEKQPIKTMLKQQMQTIFEKLKIVNTKDILKRYISEIHT